MQLLHKQLLPIQLTNGNDGRGSRWFKSANVRKSIESTLRAKKLVRTPFSVPVALIVTRILGKGQRLWDVSSCGRGNWKEIEDALVACGWFKDDGPKYITDIRFQQNDWSRDIGPTTLVEVYQSEREGALSE